MVADVAPGSHKFVYELVYAISAGEYAFECVHVCNICTYKKLLKSCNDILKAGFSVFQP